MRRPPRRASGAGEHDAENVGVLVVGGERAEPKQLLPRLRREPIVDVGRRTAGDAFAGLEAGERLSQVTLEDERIVLGRLDAHQQAVEGGHVDPGRIEAALERLDERRPGAGERVEDSPARWHVAAEQLLDELRDVLAEVGMKAMDVPRPLPLGQVALRPGEIEIEAGVDLLLRDAHGNQFQRVGAAPALLRPPRPARGLREA